MKLRIAPVWAVTFSMAALLAGCASNEPRASLTPGAAACSRASLTNPLAQSEGLGGTGIRLAVSPDPGGIGGTGQQARSLSNGLGGTGITTAGTREGSGLGGTGISSEGSGLGGTGVVADKDAGGGLGGTGIVGVITGFASICVNGVEVSFDPGMPVDRDGTASSVTDLAVGQVVALRTVGQGDQLQAQRIVVLDAAVGPLTAMEASTARFSVMGQEAIALERSDLEGLSVGDWVRVSGLRLADGQIRASRVQATEKGTAQVTGPLIATAAGGLRIGMTPVNASVRIEGVPDGTEVGASGQWLDGRLEVRAWHVQPTREAVGASGAVLLQGYVHAVQGNQLRLGYESLTLGEHLKVSGGDLRSLKVDQPVQVKGRMDENKRVIVEQIQIRSEGRRGVRATSTVPKSASTSATTGPTPGDSLSGGAASGDSDDSGGRRASSDDSGRRSGDDGNGRRGSGRGSSGSSGSSG
ncbi:MAG: hypothetical protein KDF54_11900, partial [Hydrogenophaga sp.]|nr:hypothetical protein [Hydrogenophaga sp.]